MAMKQRGSKMNSVQREYLIDFMCTNTKFAAGRFVGPMGHDNCMKTWAMLAHDLNLKGPDKTIEQWKKVWTDIKSKTRSKVGEIRADHNKTDNIARDDDIPLSGSDMKVIAIIGEAGTEGLREVAESLPESVKSLRKLMNGDESGLFDDEDEFSIRELCTEEVSNNDGRPLIKRKSAGPSGSEPAVEAGPSSRPTCAEKNINSCIKRDGRVVELLEEQNKIMGVIASNGGRLNELLEEIVSLKRRKLALLEGAQAAD